MSTDATVLSQDNARSLARTLGWFSIALGTAQLFAADGMVRWLGMPGRESVLRICGVREIGTGLGILVGGTPATWMWGRVLGDGLDMATLAPHVNDGNAKRSNVGLAMAAVIGVAVTDIVCAQALSGAAIRQRLVQQRARRDYSRRSGFRRPPDEMRGAARDFVVPDDMRIPKALRPYDPA